MGKDNMEIKEAKWKDIDYLKTRLRKEDIEELNNTIDMDVSLILESSFKVSKKCWTLLLNDEPVFVFGVADFINNTNIGSIWLLGSKNIEKVKIKLLKESKKYIKEMMKGYDMLENYVSSDNILSIKWLKWCGFIIEDEKPIGFNGTKFRRFYMEA